MSSADITVIEGYRIEVVVGKRDEAKAQLAQFDNFLDDSVGGTLTWTLAARTPGRTERTMFGAATNLHRGPHVPVTGKQVPARGSEFTRLDTTARIGRLGSTLATICEDRGPDLMAIALDNSVGTAEFDGLFRI